MIARITKLPPAVTIAMTTSDHDHTEAPNRFDAVPTKLLLYDFSRAVERLRRLHARTDLPDGNRYQAYERELERVCEMCDELARRV